jgi:hypothetical protein
MRRSSIYWDDVYNVVIHDSSFIERCFQINATCLRVAAGYNDSVISKASAKFKTVSNFDFGRAIR